MPIHCKYLINIIIFKIVQVHTLLDLYHLIRNYNICGKPNMYNTIQVLTNWNIPDVNNNHVKKDVLNHILNYLIKYYQIFYIWRCYILCKQYHNSRVDQHLGLFFSLHLSLLCFPFFLPLYFIKSMFIYLVIYIVSVDWHTWCIIFVMAAHQAYD